MAGEQETDSALDISESFADLGLTVGCSFTIEAIASARKYQVQLIGYLDKRSILITPPLRDGREVLLENNTALAVRLLEGKKVCGFETKIVYRSSHPYTYYHLQFPESVNTRQIRNSERVDTNLDVSVDSDFDVVSDWPKAATIINLSKSGTRMVSAYSLGEKGHELILTFEILVSGIQKKLEITCIIRNVEFSASYQNSYQGHYIVGVEFINMNDEVRLSLSNYIYENDRK